MSTALLESPGSLFSDAASVRSEPGPVRPAGGRGVTLEERLDGALRAAQAEGVAECPVCRAAMHREGAAARCTSCGSTLS